MKKTKVGQNLIHGLNEVLAHVRGDITLRTSDTDLPSEPPMYSKEEIKAIRQKLNYSQGVMGRYLAVEDQTVRSWESGAKKPTGSARRLIQILTKNPSVFKEEAPTPKVKRRATG